MMDRNTEMKKDEKDMTQETQEDLEELQTTGDVAESAEEGGAGEPEEVFSESGEGSGELEGEDGATSEPAQPARSEAEVLQEDLARLRDQHLRLAADFENYRKRVTADLTSGWVRAQAELAKSLLDGLDDLQRVSQFTTEDATLETLIEGVDLVERKFVKALTDAGLKAVDPTGEVFDPNSMEAMMRVPVEEEGQDETVHQVFQKGYLFKDQLVRPARVSVYKDDD